MHDPASNSTEKHIPSRYLDHPGNTIEQGKDELNCGAQHLTFRVPTDNAIVTLFFYLEYPIQLTAINSHSVLHSTCLCTNYNIKINNIPDAEFYHTLSLKLGSLSLILQVARLGVGVSFSSGMHLHPSNVQLFRMGINFPLWPSQLL